MAKIITAKEVVSLIKDQAVITVSSSSGLGCPDLVLKALGDRFDKESKPRDITTIHPIAAGDMYGIKGIDHIAKTGLLKRVLSGSYPSGPSSKPMPKIWQMIIENKIVAYNVPSGILFDMHREVAADRPGVFTKVGLDTFVDCKHQGCAMNDLASASPIVFDYNLHGQRWLHFPNIVPDVAIIRATTADEKGNLSYEQEGAYLGSLEQAMAVRCNGGIVIAQVKRITSKGSIKAHDVHIPGHLVDYIVVDPKQKQTTETYYDPAISGEIRRDKDDFLAPKYSIEKIIARRAAMELKSGQTVNLGFGISAIIPYILLEEGCDEKITWVVEQGAVGGIPLTGFAFGCAANADAFVPSPQQFIYFQGGGFDVTCLSFMEIDIKGNVNVSKLAKKPYLTAGCGGFVDIISQAKKIVFSGFFEAGAELAISENGIRVKSPGKFTKIVDQVEQVTFSGSRSRQLSQNVTYITERCVIKLTSAGLVATEIMPGIDPQKDIVSASHGRISIDSRAKISNKSLLRPSLMGLTL